MVEAALSADRSDNLSVSRTVPGTWTTVQFVSGKSREGSSLEQMHLMRTHTLFQNPRELRRGVGSVAWETGTAKDFYQLPSGASGSFPSSLNQGGARL